MKKVKRIERLPHIWSILPEELVKIKHNYQRYLTGDVKIDKAEALKEQDEQVSDFPETFFLVGNTAVMNISGVLTPKSSFFSFLFGGSTLDVMTRDFHRLIDDDSVKAIVMEIDSPGGSVFGVQEFANLVYEGRERKPIYAITNALMTSAAYWIGSAANEVFITDNSTITGSIGVVIEHIDVSELERKMGIKTTEITAGRFKRIASSVKPLSEEGRAELQSQVDHVYNSFVEDIAKFRGTSVENVLTNMADGKLFIGNQAIDAGLIDNISDIDSLIDLIELELEKDSETFITGRNIVMNTSSKSLKTSVLTVEAMKEKYPDIATALIKEGLEASYDRANEEALAEIQKIQKTADKKFDEGYLKGQEDERNRIKSVQEQSIAGHEKLIEALMYDGKTTGAEAAMKILQAEKQNRQIKLSTLEIESEKPVSNSMDINSVKSKTLKEVYEQDVNLQNEFPTYEAYEAYEKNMNAGNIRIFSRK